MLYFDTETTGLDEAADVLEFALVDDAGAVRLAARCAPVRTTEWAGAQRIHGIRPEDVAGLPSWEVMRPLLLEHTAGEEVCIYNAPYDLQFVPELQKVAKSVHCCMRAYTERFGAWSDYHQDYRWVKLTEAAQHAGHQWPSGLAAHSAIGDCLATRRVWHWLQASDPMRP